MAVTNDRGDGCGRSVFGLEYRLHAFYGSAQTGAPLVGIVGCRGAQSDHVIQAADHVTTAETILRHGLGQAVQYAQIHDKAQNLLVPLDDVHSLVGMAAVFQAAVLKGCTARDIMSSVVFKIQLQGCTRGCARCNACDIVVAVGLGGVFIGKNRVRDAVQKQKAFPAAQTRHDIERTVGQVRGYGVRAVQPQAFPFSAPCVPGLNRVIGRVRGWFSQVLPAGECLHGHFVQSMKNTGFIDVFQTACLVQHTRKLSFLCHSSSKTKHWGQGVLDCGYHKAAAGVHHSLCLVLYMLFARLHVFLFDFSHLHKPAPNRLCKPPFLSLFRVSRPFCAFFTSFSQISPFAPNLPLFLSDFTCRSGFSP